MDVLHDHWHLLDVPTDLPRLPIANDKLRAIVARRGVVTEDDFRRFAAPMLSDLHDPAGIHGMAEACARLERGIDVIITDHHRPPGTLPEAAAVLNPKQPGCDYPFKELAGVGVAFKLCCELVRRNKKKTSIESLLKIAAIGTVADVAPLVGENRTIAWLGLHALAKPRNRGLRALMRRLGLLGRPLRAVDVGFKIGPRINA